MQSVRVAGTVFLPCLLAGGIALPGKPSSAAPRVPQPSAASVAIDRSALGRSGALRVILAMPGDSLVLPLRTDSGDRSRLAYRWIRIHGGAGSPGLDPGARFRPLPPTGRIIAPAGPGTYAALIQQAGGQRQLEGLHLLVEVPFAEKHGGEIHGYAIGTYPTEGSGRSDRYRIPSGFTEVTKDIMDLRLSTHFTLGSFVTHDQRDVWPKFAVVDLRLIDKLELVMAQLERSGVPARHMFVMSGFRTPQYNRRGLDQGRAVLSRHQYGDAADVWVDNDGDGYMDDLDGDGRRDTRDARLILAAVERVERQFPDLVGGAGVYPDNGAHGPFIHIDARGTRARW